MTPRHLRVVYVFEFLLAVVAIFTAWSEIGGQSTLDLMPWGWKSALAIALAISIVGCTAALAAADSLWTMRSARWFMAVLVCLLITGLVSYYYALQVEMGDSEETGTISRIVVVSPLTCQTV